VLTKPAINERDQGADGGGNSDAGFTLKKLETATFVDEVGLKGRGEAGRHQEKKKKCQSKKTGSMKPRRPGKTS